MLLKGPLASLERHDRPAFEGRSGSERSTEPGSSAKTVASRRRIAYPVRAMKAKMEILVSTIRALFAKSGNVCAFPGCPHELVTDDNLYVAEVCHIEAANPRGARYNPSSLNKDRRSYNNLMILCHAHHRRIDSDPKTYTVERLSQMKAEHELLVRDQVFEANASVISQVEQSMESYWTALAKRQEKHPVPDLAVNVKPTASGAEVFSALSAQFQRMEALLEHYRQSDERAPEDLRELVQRLGYDLAPLESLPYYENPFERRNWEYHNLGSLNALLDLRALLLHAELLYLTAHAKLNQIDTITDARSKEIMKTLADIAGSSGYFD